MLVKFGQKEHMESLLKGTIYLNAMEFFKRYEDTNNIGDRDEGVQNILQPEYTEIIIDSHEYEKGGKIIRSPKRALTKEGGLINVKIHLDVSNVNLYCLYKISREKIAKDNLIFNLPKEIKEEKNYTHCVVFIDPQTFIERLYNNVKDKVLSFKSDTIEYIDKNTYHGDVGIFKKFNEYEHQNEYRVALEPLPKLRGSNKEFIVEIGDISDIAVIMKTEQLESVLEVKYND